MSSGDGLSRRPLRSSARHVVLIVAIVAGAAPARADDIEAARAHFAEGIALYKKNDFEGARRLFKQADAEHHAAAIVYNLGLAEERLGQLQAAVDAYEAYVADASADPALRAAAAAAIAQVKARATRLRIETTPPGARVFVDGAPLADRAPATFLVGEGHHVVAAQGDGWQGSKDIETKGAADTLGVALEAPPSGAAPAPPAPGPAAVAPTADATPRAPAPSGPAEPEASAFVWGAAFAFAPYYLTPVKDNPGATNADSARSVVAGPILEAGLTLNDRATFFVRGFAALGPDGKPTYAYMGGPAVSVRATTRLAFGAAFLGGRLETQAHDSTKPDSENVKARYGTDLVFGAMGEISYAVIDKRRGQWLVSVQPGFLLTEQHNDNTAFFLPIAFGWRAR